MGCFVLSYLLSFVDPQYRPLTISLLHTHLYTLYTYSKYAIIFVQHRNTKFKRKKTKTNEIKQKIGAKIPHLCLCKNFLCVLYKFDQVR